MAGNSLRVPSDCSEPSEAGGKMFCSDPVGIEDGMSKTRQRTRESSQTIYYLMKR